MVGIVEGSCSQMCWRSFGLRRGNEEVDWQTTRWFSEIFPQGAWMVQLKWLQHVISATEMVDDSLIIVFF